MTTHVCLGFLSNNIESIECVDANPEGVNGIWVATLSLLGGNTEGLLLGVRVSTM